MNQNVYVNSNHPGVVKTELTRYNGPLLTFLVRSVSMNTEDGAITQMYLATSTEVEQRDIRGQYYVPYASPSKPFSHATSQKNQTKLWDFTEKILYEKVPGYAGAGI
jgi:retinol dehydrogenase-12